ncbi:MAG TPA: sugar nucleotide-binding protein, partial [Cellvibrio sp.]
MKVLVTGANGQLGYALQKTAPDFIGNAESVLEVIGLTRAEFDLSHPDTLAAILDSYQPDAIINAAAYTAVDKAETDHAMANTVNALAVIAIARWCEQQQIPLVQVSTDFVFDGKKSSPYFPDDRTNPLGVYAQTKCAG